MNSDKTVKKCLESLVNQEVKPLEIAIVDGNSTDNTLKIIKSFQDKYKGKLPKITLIIKESNIGEARSIGVTYLLNANQVNRIAFTDSDCIVPSDWLKKLNGKFSELKIKDKRIGAVTGRIGIPEDVSILEKLIEYKESFRYPKKGMYVKSSSGMNVLWDIEVLRRIAISGISAGEDGILAYSATKEGWKIYYDPSIFVMHIHRTDIKSFFKQSVRNARGETALIYKFPERSKGDNIIQKRISLQPLILFLTGLYVILSYIVKAFILEAILIPISIIFLFDISLMYTAFKDKRDIDILGLPIILFINMIGNAIGIGFGAIDIILDKIK